MKKCVLFSVVVFLASEVGVLGQNPDRPAGIDEKSKEVIKQLTKTIEDAKNFSVVVHNKTHFIMEGRELRSNRSHKITVEKPYRISIVHTGGDPGISVTWDQETIRTVYPSRKGPVYSSSPYPKPDYDDSLAGFWWRTPGRVTDDDRIMPVLLSKNPTEEMLSAYSIQYVGDEEVEGVACYKLKQMLKQAGEWFLLVQHSKPIVVREVRVIFEGESTMSTFYRNWTFNSQLPENQFVLEKPANAITPEEAGRGKGSPAKGKTP